MKAVNRALAGVVFVVVFAHGVHAQVTPHIIEFKDGYITWTNVNSALYYTVEWLPAMTETNWTGSYRTLQDLQSSAPIVATPLPIFFRVVGSSSPLHTRMLSATTTAVAAGYYAATNLTQVDPDLTASNIATNVTIFGIAGTLSTNIGGVTYSNQSCATAVNLGTIHDNTVSGPVEVSVILQSITPGTSRWYHVTSEDLPGDDWKTFIKIFNISTNMNVDLYVYRRLIGNTCATPPPVIPQVEGSCNVNYAVCQNRDACSVNSGNASECVGWLV